MTAVNIEMPIHVWPSETEVEAAVMQLRAAENTLDTLRTRMAHHLGYGKAPVRPPTLGEVAVLRQLAQDAKAYGGMITEIGELLGGREDDGGLLEQAEGAWFWQREIVPPALAESEADDA